MIEMENMINEMVQHESCCQDLLYHYCKKGSAKFLLNYGEDIKARSILKSSNDNQEYRAGIELFCDYICSKGIVTGEMASFLLERMRENIDIGAEKKSSIVPFAFCLTDAFNSPYHWSEFVKEGGGFSVAFPKRELDEVCRKVRQNQKTSLRLSRCYYTGYDDGAINSIFEAICRDRKCDIDLLIRTRGQAGDAGKRIMQQVFHFAMCIKRARYYPEREWRIIMVASNSEHANQDGYLPTGIKDCCYRKDIMSIMRGVLSSPTGDRVELQNCLFRMFDSRIVSQCK